MNQWLNTLINRTEQAKGSTFSLHPDMCALTFYRFHAEQISYLALCARTEAISFAVAYRASKSDLDRKEILMFAVEPSCCAEWIHQNKLCRDDDAYYYYVTIYAHLKWCEL